MMKERVSQVQNKHPSEMILLMFVSVKGLMLYFKGLMSIVPLQMPYRAIIRTERTQKRL